tara:strand:+ start:50 stop:370 length:321 start_codon:yes stop_codon:yes gene_type:complete
MSIIGIVLGVIAIGLFIWLKNDQKMSNDLHEAELQHTHQGMKALMDDFNNYQITNERKIAKLEKDMEIRFKSRDRRMDNMNKSLPSIIGQVVGQIEFSQDILNRKM